MALMWPPPPPSRKRKRPITFVKQADHHSCPNHRRPGNRFANQCLSRRCYYVLLLPGSCCVVHYSMTVTRFRSDLYGTLLSRTDLDIRSHQIYIQYSRMRSRSPSSLSSPSQCYTAHQGWRARPVVSCSYRRTAGLRSGVNKVLYSRSHHHGSPMQPPLSHTHPSINRRIGKHGAVGCGRSSDHWSLFCTCLTPSLSG